MKFEINRSILINALSNVSKASSTKSSLPILEYIKFNLEADKLTLSATNMELAIEMTIPSEEGDFVNITDIEEGAICIKGKYILDIIRKLNGESLRIEVNGFVANIKCGKSEFNINALNADDFPALPRIYDDFAFTLPSDLLRDMLRQTLIAVGREESRHTLTGIKWTLEDGKLSLVATDSHRLAMRSAQVEVASDYQLENIIIPGSNLAEVNAILDGANSLVDIAIANNQALFKIDNIIIYSKIIEGQYPDISKIIQQEATTSLEIDRKYFSEAMDRVSLIARANTNQDIRLNISADNLQLSAANNEIGKVSEELIASRQEGEDLTITFNAKYVLELLRVIDEKELVISFSSNISPFFIKGKDKEDYFYLVLPIRTLN